MNQTTGAFNASGLVANMEEKAGSFYGILHPTQLFASRAIPLTEVIRYNQSDTQSHGKCSPRTLRKAKIT